MDESKTVMDATNCIQKEKNIVKPYNQRKEMDNKIYLVGVYMVTLEASQLRTRRNCLAE